jgi:mannosyltransferase OCH1-like enzyme
MVKRALKVIYSRLPRVDLRSLYTEVPHASRRIPNHVYQTWISPALPFLVARGIRRFRRMNPDFSFSFFDNARMTEYMESAYTGHPILKLFKDLRMPSAKADIWRYCILYREGGIYCDIKSALKVPIRAVLPDDATELISFEANTWKGYLGVGRYADPGVFLSAPPESIRSRLQHPEHIVLNWFLCFEKGSPILEEVINLIVRHSPFYRGKTFENPSLAAVHFTGPLALTQAVWTWAAKTGKSPGQCGIDFSGHGLWRLFGMDYRGSPHHSTMSNLPLL